MKVVGIVAEYHPFHLGHAYQIRYAKEILGADYVIVVMSGDFVQRGTPALLEKHVRAKMALTGGADLVLELPVMWATASAEAFAQGGVSLLHALGVVDELCFGCECGTAEDFLQIAKLLLEEPAAYRTVLQDELKNGHSFPQARAMAIASEMDLRQSDSSMKSDLLEKLLNAPNNILGIEYCKALLRLSSSIRPEPVIRKGASYHAGELSPDTLPSAQAIRQAVFSHVKQKKPPLELSFACSGKKKGTARTLSSAGMPDLKAWMGLESEAILRENLRNRRYLFPDSLDLPLHYALLSALHRDNLASFQDMTPELANRIRKTITQYQSFEQYVTLLKTKEITQTHIQRALLHVYLGLGNLSKTADTVPYARILGFRKASGELLAQIRLRSAVPMVAKSADAERLLSPEAFSVFQNDVFCSSLYESLLFSHQPSSERRFIHELQKQIMII